MFILYTQTDVPECLAAFYWASERERVECNWTRGIMDMVLLTEKALLAFWDARETRFDCSEEVGSTAGEYGL